MKKLTPRQSTVMEFLLDWDQDFPPTMREIQEGVIPPMNHLNQVAVILNSLEKKRYIQRQRGKARSLVVLRSAPPMFHV